MGRPKPGALEGKRSQYPQPYGDEYDEEVEEEATLSEDEARPSKPSRNKGPPKSRYVGNQYESDDDGPDPRHMQLVQSAKDKKSQGHSKALMKKSKKHESSDDEDSDEDSSSEDERKAEKKVKKKAKKNAKKLQKATVKQKLYETVDKNELDHPFIKFVAELLDVSPKKMLKGVEQGYLMANTQTGEYNIDQFFDQRVFSGEDKKTWKTGVEKAKTNNPNILICSLYKPGGGKGEHMARGPPVGHGAPSAGYGVPSVGYGAPSVIVGHPYYNDYCQLCRRSGHACGYYD
ncbi:MAG: hypothetical protein Q9222_001309 [Ikaeria aurantiellina]